MEITTISILEDTAYKLRQFKLRCKAKNLNEVIKLLIRSYNGNNRK